MLTDIAILVAGLVAVILGAAWLTDGASSVAKRFGVTEFMIGMTIVAIGTSLPELVISIAAAVSGKADLSVGNILGSNIFNVFAILGLTSVIVPITFTADNIKKDIPLTLVISILFAILAEDVLFGSGSNTVSRIDGAILLALYVIFILYIIKTSKATSSSGESKIMKMWKASMFIVIGLAALIAGAKLFVMGATGVSHALGVSDAVIGITVVAAGTSLPELASTLVAALKGKTSMAVGNILGSNIANILLIMGTSSVITPLTLTDISITDMAVMVLAPVMLFIFALFFGTKKITRIEGAILFAIYIVYTITLLQKI